MPRPRTSLHPKVGKLRQPGGVTEELRLYEVLWHLNRGFDQLLGQFQQLQRSGLGRQPWDRLQVILEEARAETNFELCERLEQLAFNQWTHFGRLRQEHEKKLEGRRARQPKSNRRSRARR